MGILLLKSEASFSPLVVILGLLIFADVLWKIEYTFTCSVVSISTLFCSFFSAVVLHTFHLFSYPTIADTHCASSSSVFSIFSCSSILQLFSSLIFSFLLFFSQFSISSCLSCPPFFLAASHFGLFSSMYSFFPLLFSFLLFSFF